MPTRFPTGISAGISTKTPLGRILSVPAHAGEWGYYFNDFVGIGSLTFGASSTGTAFSGTSNLESRGEFGSLSLLTAATGNDLMTAYLASGSSATSPALPFWLGGSTAANTFNTEWLFATRMSINHADMGAWVGIVPTGAIYNAGPVDLSLDTVPASVTNGVYIHKAISTTAVYADVRGASADKVSQTAMSTAIDTAMTSYLVHCKNNVVTFWLGTQAALSAPVWTRIAQKTISGFFSANVQMGLVMGAKADTTVARTAAFDYVLFARRNTLGR